MINNPRKLTPEKAKERIDSFSRKHGKAHFDLACHAVFPLALSPELLYQIWVSFVPHAPWTAVADILLSPLFREVGFELYESDGLVKELLLSSLEEDSRYGKDRILALANFMTEYARQEYNNPDVDIQKLAESQNLVAMAYLSPDRAAKEISSLLMRRDQEDPEFIRLVGIVDVLQKTLAGYLPDLDDYLNTEPQLPESSQRGGARQRLSADRANDANKKPEIGFMSEKRSGRVSFEKLTPSLLAKGAVIPQALDNQWVPEALLTKMIRDGKSLKDVYKERSKYVLKEWRRALVYSEQVVVNRAYMFNNEIIVDDYDDQESRESLKLLLAHRVIVPYLVFEDSPDQKPAFDLRESLWNAWMDIVHDSDLACVKLDWGDQNDDFKRLSGIFHNYFQTLNTPQRVEHLAGHFKISQDEFPAFRLRLSDVASFAFNLADSRLVTRNDLYKEFVVADGTNVAEGYYSQKPFAKQIKQIVDLKYNVNLPDAMGRYSLTPEGSPPRSALGDNLETSQSNIISTENVNDILYALRSLSFDQISQGMYLRNLGDLALKDVIRVRNTDEWLGYINAASKLLTNPLEFPHRSAEFYAKFEALNQTITRFGVERNVAKWEPWIKLLISVGSKAIEIAFNPAVPSQRLLTTIGSGSISTGITPFIMRLAIGARTLTDADLDVSLDFMRGNVQSGREVWNDMLGQLRNTPGFKELADEIESENNSNQSPPENLGLNYYGY